MRKWIAVLAVAALALMAGCGGSSDDATSTAQQSHGQVANVVGWYVLGGHPREAEVVKYTKGGWVGSVAASFIRTPKGIRLRMGARAKVIRGDLRYTYAPDGHVTPGHKYPQWNGKGLAPLSRTITTNDGKKRQLSLKEIYIRIYDPRFSDTYHFDK